MGQNPTLHLLPAPHTLITNILSVLFPTGPRHGPCQARHHEKISILPRVLSEPVAERTGLSPPRFSLIPEDSSIRAQCRGTLDDVSARKDPCIRSRTNDPALAPLDCGETN